MNADGADTRYPHLDLEDLIAKAAGQPVGDRAGAHLARCEHCQREASRWNLVADGIRGLAAAAPETTRPARPPRPRRHALTGRWQRALVAAGSAAAALVLLAGIGVATGYVHVRLSSGPAATTALTAVSGCNGLRQADGTLERVDGNSLVVKTAGGPPVTVVTTAATFVSLSGPLRSDITDGASVMVRGSSSGGTIKAAIVTVGQPFSAVNPTGYVPVRGTVADASSAGFTLVTSGRTRIPVTTTGDTLVIIPHASPGQLPAGAAIYAIGRAAPDGTLSARALAAIRQFPASLHTGGSLTPHLHTSMHVKGCSPTSIVEALGAISATPRSGR